MFDHHKVNLMSNLKIVREGIILTRGYRELDQLLH